MEEPRLIPGGGAVDERGRVIFCNGFDFAQAGIKRLYLLSNHQAGYVRAWHGHKTEAKYVLVTRGAALVCCVPLKDLERLDLPKANVTTPWREPKHSSTAYRPTRETVPNPPNVYRFVLSDRQPAVLYIPPGYANGHMALVTPCDVMHFSMFTIEEAKGDDLRFPARAIPGVWEITEK